MSVAGAIRSLPARALRATFLALSRRRRLGRFATQVGLTRRMVRRFVAGETLEDAVPTLVALRSAGMSTTVDLLGEAVGSAEDCSLAADRYRQALRTLAARGLDGNVSLKLTQIGLDVDRQLCEANLNRILETAAESGAFVRIDMEDHTRTYATLQMWRSVRDAYPNTGVVIQAALGRSAADVEQLIQEGARIRLCKGAYNEPPSVAFADKAEVDASYARLMERLLSAGTFPALATHDRRLIEQAIRYARRESVGRERFEFQMLYGVRRDLQASLVRRGFRVRVYVPYGREWYPYFMRRLAERPANVAFIFRSLLREGRASRGGWQ